MAGDKSVVETAITKGDSLAWAGKWQESVVEFARAAKETPDSPLTRHSLAMAYSRCGRYAEALAEYEATLALLPDDLIVQSKVADMLGKLGRVDEFAERHIHIAEAWSKRRNYDRAIAAYRQVLTLVPGHLDARLKLAEALDTGGDLQDAAAEYHELARRAKETSEMERARKWAKMACEADPTNEAAQLFYQSLQKAEQEGGEGVVGGSAGLEALVSAAEPAQVSRPPEALEATRKGGRPRAGLAADQHDALNNAMNASADYLEKGLFAAAIDECLSAIEIDPDCLPIQVRLAEIYSKMGHVEDASIKYDTLAAVYLVRGQPDVSVDMYKRIVALVPDDVNVRQRLASLLLELGRGEEAIGAYVEIISLYLRAGDRAGAQQELDAILRRLTEALGEKAGDTLTADAFWAPLGEAAREYGAIDMALACFRKALEEGGSQNPRVLLGLGDLYIQERCWDEASRVFTSFKEAFPRDERPYIKCAEVLFKSGHLEASIKEFDDLAELQLAGGDLSRALATAQVMRQLAPNSPIVRLRLSKIYTARGMMGDAISELAALAQLKREQRALAEEELIYRRIVLVDPGNKQAHLNLGDLLAANGKLSDARQAYEKVLELDPADTTAQQRLAGLQRATAGLSPYPLSEREK